MIIIKSATTFRHYLDKSVATSDEVIRTDVLIKDDKIIDFGRHINQKAGRVINADGLYLFPGFIDPQVHFREPGADAKETLESGAKAACRGGFTTVVTMPNTKPTTDNPALISQVLAKQTRLACRIFPTASVTKNLQGSELTDFKNLKRAGVIALTDDGKGIQSDELMLQAFELAARYGLSILDHAEDDSLSNGGAIHLGKVSTKYKVKGIDAYSEVAHVKRGCEYSLKTGAHYHVLHVSVAESLQWIKYYRKLGAKVTVEVSPHHLLLCDEDIKERGDGSLDANFKMNPPLRSKKDQLACLQALIAGEIDAIATDHAPHTEIEKSQNIELAPFGIVGVETAFTLLYTHLVKTNKISLHKLIDLMTVGPAKLFNLPLGTIEIGGPADLVLIDLRKRHKINRHQFVSKGKNSPFHDWQCFGMVDTTICRGRVFKIN
jgi:dihydroorotase